ncbi:MAG: hypothetical protein PHV37_09515 [Candidatus Gastranaerophilales bacterium]|nr:hypothetical protein [Candidatus Gastranaerophilales bacterium]
MNIPKISVPKIDLKAIGSNVKTAAQNGAQHIKNAPKALKQLSTDTVDLAKKAPKQAIALGAAGAVAIAALSGVAHAVKSGVEHVAAKKD